MLSPLHVKYVKWQVAYLPTALNLGITITEEAKWFQNRAK